MLSTCCVVPPSVSNQKMQTQRGSSSPPVPRLSFACVFFPPCSGGLGLADNHILIQLLTHPFYPIVGQSRGRTAAEEGQSG